MDTRDKQNPLRKEIEKCLGTHTLTAEIAEDAQTLDAMKIEGLVAMVCTLKKGNRVIAQGRGSAVLNPATRYMSRAVHTAFNSSISDAVIRATKVLGTLIEPETRSETTRGEVRSPEESSERATDRQREYLRQLIQINCEEEERERWEKQLDQLTKSEASEAIQQFSK